MFRCIKYPIFLIIIILVTVSPAGNSTANARQEDAQKTAKTAPNPEPATQNSDSNDNKNQDRNDNLRWIAIFSIVATGFTIAVGSIAPAMGEGRAVATALSSIAQQPDASNTITRTLFVGLAMIESTAIYCFVVSMILLFANPFWNYFTQ